MAADKTNDILVGGTLHSIATGNIIAHADEVQDEDWGSNQALINQELKNSINGNTEDLELEISELENKVGTNDYSESNYLEEETNLTDAVKELDSQLKTSTDSLSQSITLLDQEAIKEVLLDGVAITPSDNKVNIPLASTSADGVMSSEDKTKLDKIIDTGDGTLYLTDDGTYVSLDKNSVGLGNVDNTADLDKPISTATLNALDDKVDKETGKSLVADDLIIKLEGLDDLDTIDAAIDDKIPLSQKGVANGVATLGDNGKVPASQLPSYVDDVLEGTYVSATEFTLADGLEGEVQSSSAIYVDTTTNKTYRWSGTLYVIIGTDLALGETSETAYPGDKGKEVTDRVTEVYGANSVINGISDITFDTDDTSGLTLSAVNAIETWDGSNDTHDFIIPYATTSKAGVMSASDKEKVEEITNIQSLIESLLQSVEENSESISELDSSKQDTLVSGTNIKTINGETMLGSGDIVTPDTTYDVATQNAAGLMSSDDKTKLDGIQEDADAVSFSQTKTSGTEIGQITINGTATSIYASEVSVSQTLTSGTEVGRITIDGTTTILYSLAEYTLPTATSSVIGGIKLGSDTELSVTANSVSSTSGRTYAVQLNSNDQAVVNVPWTDTTYNEATTSTAGLMSSTDKSNLDTAVSNITDIQSSVSSLESNLEAEISNRQSADLNLQDQINNLSEQLADIEVLTTAEIDEICV